LWKVVCLTAFMAQTKRRKMDGLTKYKDKDTVGKWCEALSAKANKGEFAGLRAVTPAKPSAAKTNKNSGRDFVYGVLLVTLLTFSAKAPANQTSKWYCCCTSDCHSFMVSLAQTDFFELVRFESSLCCHLVFMSFSNYVYVCKCIFKAFASDIPYFCPFQPASCECFSPMR